MKTTPGAELKIGLSLDARPPPRDLSGHRQYRRPAAWQLGGASLPRLLLPSARVRRPCARGCGLCTSTRRSAVAGEGLIVGPDQGDESLAANIPSPVPDIIGKQVPTVILYTAGPFGLVFERLPHFFSLEESEINENHRTSEFGKLAGLGETVGHLVATIPRQRPTMPGLFGQHRAGGADVSSNPPMIAAGVYAGFGRQLLAIVFQLRRVRLRLEENQPFPAVDLAGARNVPFRCTAAAARERKPSLPEPLPSVLLQKATFFEPRFPDGVASFANPTFALPPGGLSVRHPSICGFDAHAREIHEACQAFGDMLLGTVRQQYATRTATSGILAKFSSQRSTIRFHAAISGLGFASPPARRDAGSYRSRAADAPDAKSQYRKQKSGIDAISSCLRRGPRGMGWRLIPSPLFNNLFCGSCSSPVTIDAISVGESHNQPFRQASRTSATSLNTRFAKRFCFRYNVFHSTLDCKAAEELCFREALYFYASQHRREPERNGSQVVQKHWRNVRSWMPC